MVHDKELVCTCHYFEHQQPLWWPDWGENFLWKSEQEWASDNIRFYLILFARVTTVHLWARVMALSRRWMASGGCCTTPGSMVSQCHEHIMMMISPAILGKINSSPGRLMLMDKISWRNGWPVVGVPSDTPMPAPRVNKKKQSRSHSSKRPLISNVPTSKSFPPRTSSKYFSFSSIVP